MAGSTQRPNEVITGINVTPLVDVMLVLLIIFMVTANYINSQTIKVELPKAATGETPDGIKNLAFVVDEHSNIYLDGIPFSLQELPERVRSLKQETNDLQALIGADKNARHGRVIELIDALRRNGIYDFAINIEAQ